MVFEEDETSEPYMRKVCRSYQVTVRKRSRRPGHYHDSGPVSRQAHERRRPVLSPIVTHLAR